MTDQTPQNQSPSPTPPGAVQAPSRLKTIARIIGFLLLGCVAFVVTMLFLVPGRDRRAIIYHWSHSSDTIPTILIAIIFTSLSVVALYVLTRMFVTNTINAIDTSPRVRALFPAWFAASSFTTGFTLLLVILLVMAPQLFFGSLLNAGETFSVLIILIAYLFMFILLLFLINPLLTLLLIHFLQAKRRIACQLLLIQAAAFVKNGVNPARVLGNIEPSGTYLNGRQFAIFNQLNKGVPFAAALVDSLPALSRRDHTLILTADRLGILGPVLSQKADELRSQHAYSKNVYVTSIVLIEWSFLTTLVMFTSIFIMPKFEKIFEDFGTNLPFLTKTLLYFSKWMLGSTPDQTHPGYIYIFLGLTLLLFLLTWWRPIQSWLAGRLLLARIPILSNVILRSSLVDACTFLAHAARAGIPFPEAIHSVQSLRLNPIVKARLASWEANLRAGQLPAQAARNAGLPELLAAFLQAAHNGPDTGAALDRLAIYYQSHISRARIVLESLAMPVIILITGTVIGGFIYALFAPMVKLVVKLN